MRWRQIPDAVKQALQKIIDMKREIADVDRQIAEKEERLTQIAEEQDRIRQNMEQLDHDSELYGKYVTKLSAQEDEFEQIRTDIAKLTDQRNGLQKELEDYISKLTVE